MKKKYKPVVLILAVVVLAFVLLNTQNLPFSVVSISDISFDTVNNRWIATNIVVDNDERLDFLTTNMKDTTFDASSPIQSAQGTLAFSFITKAKQPYCSYALTWDVVPINVAGFPIGSSPYARLTSPAVLEVPYDFTVARQDGISETKTMNASILGANSVKLINDMVEVRNLGQLSNGISCSSEGMAIIPIYTNNQITSWRLVSQSSLDSWKIQLNNIINNCIFNPFSCPAQIASLLSNPNVSAPNTVYLSTNIDTISQGSTKFIGYIPQGSAVPNIVVYASKDFVQTVIVYKPNGIPQPTLSFNNNTITQGGVPAVMTVNVKNVGSSADSFRLIPSTNGIVSFYPAAQDTSSVAVNGSTSKTFSVNGLGSGAANISVSVCGIGSGKCANATGVLTVNASTQLPPEPIPQPIEVCGNGLCVSTAGENYYTCAKDCGVPPVSCVCGDGVCCGSELITCNADCFVPDNTPTPREDCLNRATDVWVVGWNWNEGILGIGSGCSPIYNFTLIGLIALVGLVGIGGIVVYFMVKPKRRR